MEVKKIVEEKEIQSLKVVGFNGFSYRLRNMTIYKKIMIVDKIVVNIECNSDELNEDIINRIKNNDYDFCGIIGVLIE